MNSLLSLVIRENRPAYRSDVFLNDEDENK